MRDLTATALPLPSPAALRVPDRADRGLDSERDRLRDDVHDRLAPLVTGLAFGLAGLRGALRRDFDPDLVQERLAELHAQARDAIAEVGRLVDGLAPLAVEDGGLPAALANLARRRSRGGGPSIRVDCDPALEALPPGFAAVAYEIALEAIANAGRHAGAQHVDVRVRRTEAALVLSVADDGCGFDATAMPGVGLGSMRRRAERHGGQLLVEPRPGAGTRVHAQLPLGSAGRDEHEPGGAGRDEHEPGGGGRIVCTCPRPGAQITTARASCAS